jgi:hypothetical protein
MHHSYGSYAPSTYGSYESRKTNPSTDNARAHSFPAVVGVDISPALVRSANARLAAQVADPGGAKPLTFAHRTPRPERLMSD